MMFKSVKEKEGVHNIINSKPHQFTVTTFIETEVEDKCKVFQVDNDLWAYDPKEGIDVFWEKVFNL